MCNDLSPPPDSLAAPLARRLAERLEQLARVLASRALAHGLNSAQWTALRYLASADEAVCHVGGFAAFHLTTASSASQTMTALTRKGLVTKRPGTDARRRTLSLTEAGRQILAHDPLGALIAKIERLAAHKLEILADVIDELTGPALASQ